MIEPLRIHGGATREEIAAASIRRYVGARCVLGRTLVMPLRLLWNDYKAWDSSPVSAKEFRKALEASPWAAVEERGGKGRFRTVVLGLGLHATASPG